MLYPKDIEAQLASFKKPEHLTALREGYWISDGIQYLITHTYSEWLLAKILKWMRQSPDLRLQRFQIFVLKVDLESRSAVLEAQNEERQVIRKEHIEFTDFPLPWGSIWVKDKILMLPSEFAHSF